MKPKVGIVGKGNVGGALQRGLERSGIQVRTAGNDPRAVREAAAWADVIILAVPFSAVGEVVRELGEAADGKPLIDVTNALTPDYQLALGFTASGAEELQKQLPKARVVKAFNTVFSQAMDSGRINDQQLTAFVAGDDAQAKTMALQLARDIGFDGVDAGPLKNARYLEPLGFLNIQLGYTLKLGTQIGIRLIH